MYLNSSLSPIEPPCATGIKKNMVACHVLVVINVRHFVWDFGAVLACLCVAELLPVLGIG